MKTSGNHPRVHWAPQSWSAPPLKAPAHICNHNNSTQSLAFVFRQGGSSYSWEESKDGFFLRLTKDSRPSWAPTTIVEMSAPSLSPAE